MSSLGPSPFVIAPLPGCAPEISRLVGMMAYARLTTLQAVMELTVAELDHVHDGAANSIGAILAHIGALEVMYQRTALEVRRPTAADRARWGAAFQLGPDTRAMTCGRTLESYVADLAEVRARTLAELMRRPDAWLNEIIQVTGRPPVNRYFSTFHVFEDELNHRGQIRWLRQRLPQR